MIPRGMLPHVALSSSRSFIFLRTSYRISSTLHTLGNTLAGSLLLNTKFSDTITLLLLVILWHVVM